MDLKENAMISLVEAISGPPGALPHMSRKFTGRAVSCHSGDRLVLESLVTGQIVHGLADGQLEYKYERMMLVELKKAVAGSAESGTFNANYVEEALAQYLTPAANSRPMFAY